MMLGHARSLPVPAADPRARHVERLLATRIPESLGDAAVLEAEVASLLDLPALALGRAGAAIYRNAETEVRWRDQMASAACAVVAAGTVGIAHVGDCRVSRIRSGSLEALTTEHRRALGMSDVSEAQSIVVPAEPGDVYLMFTRGASATSMELIAAVRGRRTEAFRDLGARAGAVVAIEIL
jgi:hypothetical protein